MEGLGNGETENREAGFRVIRPSQSDAPSYQSVPDGNSEISVPSVLKITMRGDYLTQTFIMARRNVEGMTPMKRCHALLQILSVAGGVFRTATSVSFWVRFAAAFPYSHG